MRKHNFVVFSFIRMSTFGSTRHLRSLHLSFLTLQKLPFVQANYRSIRREISCELSSKLSSKNHRNKERNSRISLALLLHNTVNLSRTPPILQERLEHGVLMAWESKRWMVSGHGYCRYKQDGVQTISTAYYHSQLTYYSKTF